MSNTKHTPGPWTVSTAPGTVDVRAFDGRFIANVDCDKRTALVETDSNAKLIAAAPEMAEALQELLCGVLHGFQRHNESDCIEMARAALAKASLSSRT